MMLFNVLFCIFCYLAIGFLLSTYLWYVYDDDVRWGKSSFWPNLIIWPAKTLEEIRVIESEGGAYAMIADSKKDNKEIAYKITLAIFWPIKLIAIAFGIARIVILIAIKFISYLTVTVVSFFFMLGSIFIKKLSLNSLFQFNVDRWSNFFPVKGW